MKSYFYLLMMCLTFGQGVFAQCSINQSQDSVNGGRSARNLAGYFEGQTFTPSVSGLLCEVSMNMFSAGTGSGTLNIYDGNSVNGSVLHSQNVNVNTPGGAYTWQNWSISSPLIMNAGQIYTFQFIPTQGSGLSDPYGVGIYASDIYNGGFDISEPTWDLSFRISIDIATKVSEQISALQTTLFPQPLKDRSYLNLNLPLKHARLRIYDLSGKIQEERLQISGNQILVERNNLAPGIYFLEIAEDNIITGSMKLLVID